MNPNRSRALNHHRNIKDDLLSRSKAKGTNKHNDRSNDQMSCAISFVRWVLDNGSSRKFKHLTSIGMALHASDLVQGTDTHASFISRRVATPTSPQPKTPNPHHIPQHHLSQPQTIYNQSHKPTTQTRYNLARTRNNSANTRESSKTSSVKTKKKAFVNREPLKGSNGRHRPRKRASERSFEKG